MPFRKLEDAVGPLNAVVLLGWYDTIPSLVDLNLRNSTTEDEQHD